MILPGTLIGSGVTVRVFILSESEAGPQFPQEKPRMGDF